MKIARWIASASCCASYGLTSKASVNSSAAPVNVLRIRHAAVVAPGCDEFLGDEVHPVVQRRDEADVRRAVEAGNLVVRMMALQEHDRLPAARIESRVDAFGFGRDFLEEAVVPVDLGPARCADLHEREAPFQIGFCFEQPLDSAEALENAFRVVHAVDADREEFDVESEVVDDRRTLALRAGRGVRRRRPALPR